MNKKLEKILSYFTVNLLILIGIITFILTYINIGDPFFGMFLLGILVFFIQIITLNYFIYNEKFNYYHVIILIIILVIFDNLRHEYISNYDQNIIKIEANEE